jgi:two-component system, sensor histidine kinase and response regulator
MGGAIGAGARAVGNDRGVVKETAKGLDSEVLDAEQIELLRSLDDGKGDVLAEIVGEFVTTSDDARDRLRRALDERDPATARGAAHSLKGASANVGAAGLARVCAEVEAQAGAGSLDEASPLVAQFEAEYSRALGALQALSTPS